MATLADVNHIWGEDIGETATGDLAVVTNNNRTKQRILRRLMTAATTALSSQYPWQPTYGKGLPEAIGDVLQIRALTASIQTQMALEPTVVRIPAPVVTITPIAEGATIDIAFTDTSGEQQNLSFNVTNSGD